MTVCVAAICQPGMLIGASDRMLTAGDIQFEPDRQKIVPLTTSIFAMTAGDAAIQDELLSRLREDIAALITPTLERWISVRELAEAYAGHYADARARKAERKILNPLGLTREIFLTRQREMDSNLVSNISTELLNFEMADISTLFCGIDGTGPHIYVVDNAEVDCRDSVGFAAIGIGQWHASSQLMLAGQSRNKYFPETLLNVYAAKKRSEVAPGVGQATDMFLVHGLGQSSALPEHEVVPLNAIYEMLREKEIKAFNEANGQCQQYVEDLVAAAAPQQQAIPEDQASTPSSDSKEAPASSS